MNNQAAQTMPYLIVERLAAVKDHFPAGTDERKAVWQAIEYFRAAALSQTAGVAMDCEKCGGPAVHYLVMDNLPQPGRRIPFCEYCTREHEQTAQEVNDHEMRHFGGSYGLVAYHYEPLAAPAASGWNITDHSHEISFDDGLDGPAASGGEEYSACCDTPAYCSSVRRCTAKDSPPAGASVSERAREWFDAYDNAVSDLFADEETGWNEGNRRHWMRRRIARLRAILIDALEQALTQQRGSEDGRSTLYSREALEIQGARWRALCRVIDHMSPGWDSGYIGAVETAGAAVRALTTNGATTPQPGDEALRELVQRWRKGGHPFVLECADELESLLARGGK